MGDRPVDSGRTGPGQRRRPRSTHQTTSRGPGPGTTRREVNDMAASLIIEEESGTSRGWVHPHNGYYAGDFWTDWRDPEDRAESRH